MKKIILIVVVIPLLLIIGAAAWLYFTTNRGETVARLPSPSSIRDTPQGEIKGVSDRYETHAWLGIPYARAGRWQAPRPPAAFTERFDASEFGNVCPQVSIGQGAEAGTIIGDEDCLFLNLWAPIYPEETVPTGDDRLPVMFWIHGGGNSVGQGGTAFYNGSLMASEHDVIVVTINYRLGPLGWFSHPALRKTAGTRADASGNYGTLDIIAALQWVQRNISAFGGDPNRVTIYGESAGGVDVLSMMASPLAKGLFHRAIVQSGGLGPMSIGEAENFTDEQPAGDKFSSKEVINRLLIADGMAPDREAAKRKQQSMSAAEIMDYLKGKSAREIIGVYQARGFGMLTSPDLFADGYVLPLTTEVDRIFANTANYNAVPVVLGTNRDEVKLFQALSDDMVDKFKGLPYAIKDREKYERDSRYRSDLWKVRGVDRLATLMRRAQGESVYAYRFDADELRNFAIIDLKELLGAAHAMEIPYVFGIFEGTLDFIYPGNYKGQRNLLSNTMMSYWAEFAYEGAPGSGRNDERPAWSSWQNMPQEAERLMILDMENDGGVRMSSFRLTLAGIKRRFMEDTSMSSRQARCDAYEQYFRGDSFVADEYRSLGCQ